jgi:tetratricopeptide (TPR) repeat protein
MISFGQEDNKPVWVIGRDIINKINAGEFEDVEKNIDLLVTQKPYTVDGTRVLEKLYPFVAERLQSSDMLDRWCSQDPSHHSSFIFRGNYYLDQAWKHRGTGFGYTITQEGRQKFNEYLELAKKDFEKAYSMNPDDPNSAASMIRVCTGLNMDEGDMETWFKRAIKADPVSYAAYASKQNYLRPKWHGTPEKDRAFADYCYKKAPKKSVIHEIMLDYIIEYYKWTGKEVNYFDDPSISKTIDDVVKKTLKNFPDSTSIRRKLAEIETFKKNYGNAVSLYNEILVTDPGNPEALRLRGNLYTYPSFQNVSLAERDIKKSIESDPDGPNNYETLARMARINGNFEKAIEYLTIAIKRKPKTPHFYVDRGYIKMESLSDNASALEDFKEALKLDTLSVPANLYMTFCLVKLQQYDEAKKYCMKALDILETRKSNLHSLSQADTDNYKRSLNSMLQWLNRTPNQPPMAKMHSTGNLYPVPGGFLSQYTGTYKLAPDTDVMIRVLNGLLISQITGQPVVGLSQESDVIFFNRRLNTGVELFKDESGNITHLMLTQDGVVKKAVRTSDKITDKNAVTLTADTLSQYVGTYKMANLDLMITRQGDQLFAQFPGMILKALFPESETLFFDNIIDTRLEFFKDKGGKVTHLVFTQNNHATTAPRIENATTAPRIERETASAPDNYGLTEKTAIKTGGGPKGEHDYLNMLCGPNGEKIKFKRLGSCCGFETPNSPFGRGNTGFLDKYEVTYDGLKEPVIVYLNMYDPPTGEFYAPPGLKMRNKKENDHILSPGYKRKVIYGI